jgi:hypothetical protein
MSHTLSDLGNGWTIEYLRDESDFFISLLKTYSTTVKTKITDYVSRTPFGVFNAIGSYACNVVDSTLGETIEKIRTEKDLRGCSHMKLVKEKDGIRAEIRMEEIKHDKVIEVEVVAYRLKNEANKGPNRENLYFWEEDYTILPEEEVNIFKARVANDVRSQSETIDELFEKKFD